MSAVVLSLAAALSWGVADFGAGLKARQLPVFTVLAGMLFVGSAGAAAAVVLAGAPLERDTGLLGLAAGTATAIGLTSLYRGLAIGPMSVVAPISAAGVIIPVGAGLAGGDLPSAAQLIGIALAVVGMLTVVACFEDPAGAGGGGGRRATAVGLAIVGAIGLGIYFLAADAVPPGQSAWFLLLGQLFAGIALATVIRLRRLPLPSRADALHIVVLGGLSFGAWAASTAAVGAGHLSLTSTLSSLYPVVTVLLAVGIAGESLRRPQIPALIAAFLGVALIASG